MHVLPPTLKEIFSHHFNSTPNKIPEVSLTLSHLRPFVYEITFPHPLENAATKERGMKFCNNELHTTPDLTNPSKIPTIPGFLRFICARFHFTTRSARAMMLKVNNACVYRKYEA